MPSGGYREGSGRKPNIVKAMQKVIAEQLFDVFGGESQAWQALANDARVKDPRLVFDILRYWTDRKYGKVREVKPDEVEDLEFGDLPGAYDAEAADIIRADKPN